MAGFSDYLENALLDHVLKVAAFTVPTNIYVALFTAAPSDAGGGTEVSASGYARVVCNAWDAASGGATDNTNAIEFAAITPSGSDISITHFALFDALTAGNQLAWGALSAALPAGAGVATTVTFPAGALDLSLD